MNRIWSLLSTLLALMLLLIALASAVVRLGLANLENLRPQIESWIAEEVIPGVTVSQMHGEWRGWNPVLRLDRAAVTLPDRSQPLRVDGAGIEIDVWRSLYQQKAVVRQLYTQIEQLELAQSNDGVWRLNRVPLERSEDESVWSDVSTWLARFPRQAKIRINRLILRQDGRANTIVLRDITFDTQRRGDTIDTLLHARMASDEQTLSLQAKFSPLSMGMEFAVNSVDAVPWLAWFGDSKTEKIAARMTATGRLAWRQDKPVLAQLLGEINGELSSQSEQPFAFALNLDARGRWQNVTQAWRVESDITQLKLAEQNVAPFHVALKGNGTSPVILGAIDQMSLQPWVAALPHFSDDPTLNTLAKAQVSADLSSIVFQFDPTDMASTMLGFQFTNWRNQPTDAMPGIEGLAGQLSAGRQGLSGTLSGRSLKLDFADNFVAPLKIDDWHLALEARRDDSGFRVNIPAFKLANTDISAEGRGWLEFDGGDAPFLYLRTAIDRADAAATGRYLPVKLLPPATLEWLNKNIRQGDIRDGHFLFHGRMVDVEELEYDAKGTLKTDFLVNNPYVGTTDGWPDVQGGEARIGFDNLSFYADVGNTHFGELPVQSGLVSIASLIDVTLHIEASADNPVNLAMKQFLDLPVGGSYRVLDQHMQALDGLVRSTWTLDIPLEEHDFSNTQVLGLLDFNDVSFSSPAIQVEISQLQGQLKVTEDGVSADALTGNYFENPIQAKIRTNDQTDRTEIHASGLMNSRHLTRLLPQSSVAVVEGNSDWDILIALDNRDASDDRPFLKLQARSTLEGTNLGYPPPFNKAAEIRKPLELDLEMDWNSQMRFESRFGTQLAARGVLIPDRFGRYEPRAVDVAFRTELKPETSQEGVQVYGSLPTLNIKQWKDYYTRHYTSTDDRNAHWSKYLQHLDLRLNTLNIFGHVYNSFLIRADRNEEGLLGTLDSNGIKGRFEIPSLRRVGVPIRLDLDYLTVGAVSDGDGESTLRPHDLANIQLRSKVVNFKSLAFTNLELDLTIYQNNAILENLSLRRDGVELEADGLWQYLPGSRENSSQISVVIKGEKIGQTLMALGLGDELEDGDVDFRGHISWDDRPTTMDWESLTGKAYLTLDNGIFRNIDPGAGRLVGLLSVSSLWRRLVLDFEDVAEKGLKFDEIDGEYEITGEQLVINRTRVDGPASRIRVTGTANVRQREFDQQVFITPKVRQTLPVIGSIAASSTVGWALLLVQKIFEDDIDKSVEIEYKVTGSWEEPVVTLIETKQLDEATDSTIDSETDEENIN